MKHSGKAMLSAIKLIVVGLIAVIVLLAVAWLAQKIGTYILEFYGAVFGLWILFALFTLYFFRDPNPLTPTGTNLVVSPAHGKVDVIDTVAENEFMGGECKRISIFLSVIDVHVQKAPLTGRVAYFKHTAGQFLSATRSDCAQFNENLLVGIECFEPRGEKIGLRLIAGLIARRIVPWICNNDPIQRGDRISLIQFGSRVEVYLPMRAKIKVPLGQKVVGGETVLASFD
ncbi:MAG TPA: phosphatidylserine decarboxylase [Verrucomicrobiae bacterium]|nr:phosphatidylserine decarboxylase [Verrucomicrobiae bacterium]